MKRAMLPEDLRAMRWANDPRLSPDGSLVAFTVRRVNATGKGYEERIYVVPFDGKEAPRPLTLGPGDRHPRWSPDGRRLAFVSARSGRPQVWLLELAGGEARQLTAAPGGVTSAPVWAPDGERIAFLSRFLDEEAGTEALVKAEDGRSFRVIRRLYYKSDGAGYWDGRRNHICVAASRADGEAPATVTRLTFGCYDHGVPVWSPDGRELAFAAHRSPEADWVRHSFIYTMAVEPGAEPRAWGLEGGTAAAPAWSPCGRYLAYLGHDGCENRGTNTGLWVADRESGRLVNLTFDFDRSLSDTVLDDCNRSLGSSANPPVWYADGSALAFLATDGGDTHVFRVSFPGENAFALGRAVSHGFADASTATGQTFAVTRLTPGPRRVFSFDFDGRARWALAVSSLDNISDIHTGVLCGDGLREQQVTELNRSLLSEVALGRAEAISFTGAVGRTIHGWVLHPPDFDPTKQYPLLFYIHGGPYSTYGHSFIHEFQVHAGNGYCVLYTNPHGSFGYGSGLLSEYKLRRGEVDTEDQLRAVEVALAERPYLDPERVVVTGGSYAGWAVNWLITKTDRFKAAVSQRGTCNRHSSWGNSQAGFLHSQWECPAPPWEDYDFYMRISPINFADRVNTPLLIIHSELDALCNVSEAEQFFTALKYLKKDVEWVLFLGESHELSRSGSPPNRMERIRRIRDWFDKYILK